MYARSEPTRRQTEESATGSNIQEALTCQCVHLDHLLKRSFGFGDPSGVQSREKRRPILSEFKPLTLGDLSRVLSHLPAAPLWGCRMRKIRLSHGNRKVATLPSL